MVLKNWYKWLGNIYGGVYPTLINYNGTEVKPASIGLQLSANSFKYIANGDSPLTSSGNVIFGTGTKEPDINDYALSGDIIKNLTAGITQAVNFDATYHEIVTTYILTNGNGEAVTIGEVGVKNYASKNGYLFERTVLDTPVTIPAGGIGQVTYTVRMNYPTA